MINPSIEAERALLGAVFLSPEIVSQLIVVESDFSDVRHQLIYKAMQELAQDGMDIDIVSMFQRLSKHDSSLVYMTELSGAAVTSRNFKTYERMVLENSQKTKMVQKIKRFMETDDDDDYDNMIEEAKGLQSFSAKVTRTVMEDMTDIYESLFFDQANQLNMSYGFKALDDLTGGMHGGELIVVGARPSVGKTAFALNVGLSAAEKGILTDIFSIEMTRKSLLKRLISQVGNLNNFMWHNPFAAFSDEEKAKVVNCIAYIDKLPLFINEQNPLYLEDIERQIIQTKENNPDQSKHIVIIDYLQLMNTRKEYGTKTLEIQKITSSLKQMAKNYDVAIILLSQLSRNVTQREDKRPQLSDLRDSGAIEQDADIITFLHREDYYSHESENDGTIEIIVRKNREGSTGTVQLAFIKEYSKFVNLEIRYEEQGAQ
ncbi:AAA family ATPase [Listeria booriae]|uniref:DNA 5'-3' helicase n=1 Tax=Listeria booriae TaxID=1552123 RepID=A0A842FRZ2_9LIST|nr:DnaB-like helicase C-terminal domain-containing protein [Listeria booriae]MBC2285869.1 AAA family ATPase [Listeria booriae]